MRRLTVLFTIVLHLLLLTATEVSAVPALVTVEDTTPELTRANGKLTAKVTVRNLTQGDLTVGATGPNGGAKCTIQPTGGPIPGSTKHDVTLAVTDCDVPDDGLVISLVVTSLTDGTQTILLTAESPAEEADWTPMKAYPVALVLLGIAAVTSYLVWKFMTRVPGSTPSDPKKRPKLSTPLSELDSTWKFTDSWAANVTLAGGLLTGVVGTAAPVKALLGAEADNAIGVAVVGAAVAVALVGAGSIVAHALKSRSKEVFTVGSLLVGAVLTLSGAIGQVYVTAVSGGSLQEGRWRQEVYIAAALIAALLVLYAFRSLHGVLDRGVDDGVPPPDNAAVIAAKLAIAGHGAVTGLPFGDQVGAIRAAEKAVKVARDVPIGATTEEIDAAAGVAKDYPLSDLMGGTSPGDDTPRRRAVMI